MKKLLWLLVFVVAGVAGYTYLTTGRLRILPRHHSAASQQVEKLAGEFHALLREYKSAGQAAGVAGVDTSYEAGTVRLKALRIQRQVGALAVKITDETERRDAEKLQAEIQRFLDELE
jgi:hypothetical protein